MSQLLSGTDWILCCILGLIELFSDDGKRAHVHQDHIMDTYMLTNLNILVIDKLAIENC